MSKQVRCALLGSVTLGVDNYCTVHPPSFPFSGLTSQTPFFQPPHRCSSGTPRRLDSLCCPHPVQVILPQPLHWTFRHMAQRDPRRGPLSELGSYFWMPLGKNSICFRLSHCVGETQTKVIVWAKLDAMSIMTNIP